MFALVIVLDVIGTVVVMVLIYKCTKKKGSAGPVRSSKGKDAQSNIAKHIFIMVQEIAEMHDHHVSVIF